MAWFSRRSSLHGEWTVRCQNGCHRQRSLLRSLALLGFSCGICSWRWRQPAHFIDSWMSCSVEDCSSRFRLSGDVSHACWSGQGSCALSIWHLAMYVYLIHYLLRLYWEPIVLKRVMGTQMSDALGAISVVIIVAVTMVLAVAWDRWQMKDNGQRRAV